MQHFEVLIPKDHCCEHFAPSNNGKEEKTIKRKKRRYSKVKKEAFEQIDTHGAGDIGGRWEKKTKGVMHCALSSRTCARLAQSNVNAT
eukprot:2873482-Ditylum_brightwellii.AAC.1